MNLWNLLIITLTNLMTIGKQLIRIEERRGAWILDFLNKKVASYGFRVTREKTLCAVRYEL